MLKRLSTVLLFGGILGLVPAAAEAAPAPPARALAAPVDPSGSLPGCGLNHAGHDHGKKPKKPKKPNKPKHSHGHSDSHAHRDDGAHASGGYDSHRHHPRNW